MKQKYFFACLCVVLVCGLAYGISAVAQDDPPIGLPGGQLPPPVGNIPGTLEPNIPPPGDPPPAGEPAPGSQNPNQTNPNTPAFNLGANAPGGPSEGPCASTNTIGACIVNIYTWSLGIAVLLALIMIVVSGYLYMTAGGNAQAVASAKELFTGAIIGLIILFGAVLILRTINPDLVNFSKLGT